MKNSETHHFGIIDFDVEALLSKAKNEERRDRALAVSIRLEALAIHISQHEMNGIEAAELLRREAVRFEIQSRELH